MVFLYGLIGAWLVQSAGAIGFAWLFARSIGSPAPVDEEPPVTVIAPIKEVGPHTGEFLARLRALDYPDYRIVAVAEAETDPAVAALRAAATGPGAPLAILVSGLAEREGQKVHNLRHALTRLDARTRIVAFIDADTLPRPDWLGRLARPLARDPQIAAVTGNRWIVPDDGNLVSSLVAAGNMSILTVPRLWDVCWGGSLAMRRETIEALDLVGQLEGAVVDDVLITRLLRRHRLRILTPRGLGVPSPARHDWASGYAFARRQYMFVRFYLPGTWLAALAALSLPVVAATAACVLAAAGDPWGWAALGAATCLGQVRGSLRARIARTMWGDEAGRLYGLTDRASRWFAPLWAVLHAAAAFGSAASRMIDWAGTLYEVQGLNRTIVRRRSGRPG